MTTPTRLLKELRTILAFGLVGLCNTGLTAGIMVISSRLRVPYPVYTTYAYIAGMLSSFALNRIFTFRQGRELHAGRTLVRFTILNLGLLGLVHGLQFLLIERLGWRERLGVALGMVCYTGLGYILNRNWVFRHPNKESRHATH